jgi:hypothetical protein
MAVSGAEVWRSARHSGGSGYGSQGARAGLSPAMQQHTEPSEQRKKRGDNAAGGNISIRGTERASERWWTNRSERCVYVLI